MMKSRCRESTIIQSKHLDFAALHLDVAARHMKMQGKVFIHASIIYASIMDLPGSEEVTRPRSASRSVLRHCPVKIDLPD